MLDNLFLGHVGCWGPATLGQARRCVPISGQVSNSRNSRNSWDSNWNIPATPSHRVSLFETTNTTTTGIKELLRPTQHLSCACRSVQLSALLTEVFHLRMSGTRQKVEVVARVKAMNGPFFDLGNSCEFSGLCRRRLNGGLCGSSSQIFLPP